jgi:hypothetical protein
VGRRKNRGMDTMRGSMLKTRVAVPFDLLIGYRDKFCTIERSNTGHLIPFKVKLKILGDDLTWF